MAQTATVAVPLATTSLRSASRSNSLISNSSNASTGSHASLRRRSRTRTRRKSVTSHSNDVADQGLSRQAEAPPLPPLTFSNDVEKISIPQVESPVPLISLHHKVGDSEKQLESATEGRSGTRARALSSVHVRDVPIASSRGRQTKSENGSVRGVKTRARGRSLPRDAAFRSNTNTSSAPSQLSQLNPNAVPSDSSYQVQITHSDRNNIRDSMISNNTATSSSVYPQSTSASSRSDESSIFPPSLKDRDADVSSFTPRIITDETQRGDMEFDIDDVQYRLQLLVKNSYFLPPAHSKPSTISFSPQPPPSGKPSPTSIFGLFGLGKSKSKPTTPVNAHPPLEPSSAPILRTTSDNTTASGRVPPRAHPHLPTYSAPRPNPTSRVVVLREKMEDLQEAAKQAEKDIKSKVDSRKASTRQGLTTATPKQEDYLDPTMMIDPTDTVDLPPPSGNYPFAVQASMMHGLGIHESIGADVLAEQLPPSPGLWSTSSQGMMGTSADQDGWRKALLHEAVSHSLHNTPDSSFMTASPPPKQVKEMPSFRSEDLDERIPNAWQDAENEDRPVSSTPKRQVALGKAIVDPEQLQALSDESSMHLSPVKSLHPSINMVPSSQATHLPWISTRENPHRAETPAMTYALAPPPRRFSSMSDFPHSRTIFKDVDTSNTTTGEDSRELRKAASDPRLSAVQEHEGRRFLTMTPPPLAPRTVSASTSAALQTSNSGTMPSFTYSSHPTSMDLSEDESSYGTPTGDLEDLPRPSMTISLHTENLSEYDHPSPTVSAFQDAVFGSCRTPSPLLHRRSHASFADPPESVASSRPSDTLSPPPLPEPTLRHSAMSPPPRVSSSLGLPMLPPPPRSPGKAVYRSSTSGSSRSGRSDSVNDKNHSSTPLPSTRNPQSNSVSEQLIDPDRSPSYSSSVNSPDSFNQPESSFQRSPSLAERRGHPTSPLSLLRIPADAFPAAIHSAPAPSSPADFFDRIQSQPNAMDDLDTSEDESSTSDEEDGDKYGQSLPASERSILMDPRDIPRIQSQQSHSQSQSHPQERTRAISITSAKTPFMRLGNHSTPHLSPSLSPSSRLERSSSPLQSPTIDPRAPIANIPEQGTFFASRKKGMKPTHFHLPIGGEPVYRRPSVKGSTGPGLGVPGPSTSIAGPSRGGSTRRPATADAASGKSINPRRWQRESILRFDGMLEQHIAAEKDTLKKITTSLSQNSRSSQSSRS